MMTWDGFWAPNLVQWIVGGTITAGVAFLVSLVLRRALRRIEAIAQSAANDAGSAAGAADAAKEQATGARDNSRQANEAIAWLAAELGQANRRGDTLAAKFDTTLAQLLQQRVRHPEEFNGPPVEAPEADDLEAAMVTGRHRYHTTSLPKIGQDAT